MNKLVNENFSFKGFEPSRELLSRAKEILWRLEEKSPVNSARLAQLVKTSAGYQGALKIATSTSIFMAEAQEANASDALESLYQDILLELVKWNASRFDFIEE